MEETILPDTAVIDGDGIPYILGWVNKEHTDIPTMEVSVDNWMKDFLLLCGAKFYIGIIKNAAERCFRYQIYKYKPYKAGRPEKEEYMKFWEPLIRERLEKVWGFVQAPTYLETDDIVALLVEGNPSMVMCSPDKDLKQVSGWHYNYKDMGTDKHKGLQFITPEEAEQNLLYQLLVGDGTDGISGLVNCGDVKARKLLKDTPAMMQRTEIKLAYQKQYGPYYGPIIHDQTLATVQMLTPKHPLAREIKIPDKLDYKQHIKSVKDARPVFGTIEQVQPLHMVSPFDDWTQH